MLIRLEVAILGWICTREENAWTGRLARLLTLASSKNEWNWIVVFSWYQLSTRPFAGTGVLPSPLSPSRVIWRWLVSWPVLWTEIHGKDSNDNIVVNRCFGLQLKRGSQIFDFAMCLVTIPNEVVKIISNVMFG